MAIDVMAMVRRGAEARLIEIELEMEDLKEFIENPRKRSLATARAERALSSGSMARKSTVRALHTSDVHLNGPAPRKRPTWSAAQRKAIGDRMRRYWAARRAAKGIRR